ncbi:fibronectin type III domain-containing protein [Paenibacillus woosongensis]|uniref:S-layer protein n=1 Tax=Paenibacillus woosongensis TaxID=307580 RepID=A0ABQ4MYW7_9BACL|nr:S-layer homology domain-containing protein [Paenibacillus woosongensis]GIP61125.1 hypothetical protein J15TS10_49390 [Paenibacillus woosongensis]
MIRKYLSVLLSISIVLSGFTIGGAKSEAATAPVNVWDKYDTRMVWTDGEWEYQGFSGGTGRGYSGYRITSSGQFELTGEWGISDDYRYEFWSNGWLNRYRSGVEMINGKWESGYHWWYQRYAVQKPVRGNLIQSDLIGQYPDNGLHTDGYWYVKKTITNNIPTLSINNTGDKTLYNDGGSFVVSGTVQDADNETVTVSASIGGVTKSTTVTGTSSAKTWSLTWSGTELPVGVYANPTISATDGKTPVTKAYNGKLTVLAQVYYYWSKFNVAASDGWLLIDDRSVAQGITLYKRSIGQEYYFDFEGRGSPNYGRIRDLYNNSDGHVTSVDSVTGRLTTSYSWDPPAKYSNNVYETYSPIRMEKATREYGYYTDVTYTMYALTTNPPQAKGSLIQANIKAVQGTYPDDGLHTDGYWYVKAGQAPNNMPTITVNQAGNKTINLKAGSDTFTLTGTVLDADNDTLSVSSTISGVTKQVAVSNAGTSKTWTLTWKTKEFNADGDITGIQVTADDGRGGVALANYTGQLTIDKSPLYYWDKYSIVDSARGSLLEANILDLNGTYPDNGPHTDGYWYVKKTTTNMFPIVTVDQQDLVLNQAESTLSLRGTVSDADADTITISASISGVTKSTTVTDTVTEKQWSLNWSRNELPDGIYNGVEVLADDSRGGQNTVRYRGTIIIDKIPPSVSFVSPNGSPNWTSDPVSVTINFADNLSLLESKFKITQTNETPRSWDNTTNSVDIEIMEQGIWYVHAQALDIANNVTTSYYGPIKIQNKPEVPKLKLAAVGDDWTEISWNLPTDYPDGYEYIVENVTSGETWNVGHPTDKIREDGLTAGTRYNYRIKAKNHVGESAWSDQFEVLTLPAAPRNLSVQPVQYHSDQVEISFDSVSSATAYHLRVQNESGLVYEDEVFKAGTYIITGLKAGKQHTASVVAINESGQGQTSALGFLTLPAAPGEFKTILIKETEIELSWHSSITAMLYELSRFDQSIYKGAGLSYTDSNLKSSNEYDYQISAKNESGFGDIAYLKGILTLPSGVSVTVATYGTDKLDIALQPVHGADRYGIILNGSILDTTQGTTFTLTNLIPGSTYQIGVFAENRSGAGVVNTIMVKTLPLDPKELRFQNVSETSAIVEWDSTDGADKYRITLSNSTTGSVSHEISGTQFMLTGLQEGTVYNIEVAAGNSSGYGPAVSSTLLTLPGVPQGVHVNEVKSDSYIISWNPVISANKYLIFDNNGKLIGESLNTHFVVQGLEPGQVSTAYIVAVNDTGEGGKAMITQRTLPASWDNTSGDNSPIQVGDRGEHSVVITVEEVDGADAYKIVDGSGNVVGIIHAPEVAKEIGGLESAKEYNDWTIIPINEAGEGEGSKIPPFVTLPSDQFEATVMAKTQRELVVSIESSLRNEIFVISLNGKKIYRGKNKIFTVKDLKADQDYTFVIWTENSIGEKSNSKNVSGKTLPVPYSPGSGSGLQGTDSLKTDNKPVEEKNDNTQNSDSTNSSPKTGFKDIDKSFAKDAILSLYYKGIVSGVSETQFEPDRKVTRVEFASMLVRALELQEASEDALTFEDVQRTAWYAPELSAAVLNGVAHGFSDKQFRPQDPITREQAAKMIANAAYEKGSMPAARIKFKDADLIASWAKSEVAALTSEQIITGYPDETFKPKRDLTRAECAVLIYRALNLMQ